MARSAFSKNMRTLRRAKGWSFERLATEMDRFTDYGAKGSSKGYLHALEAGTKDQPSPDFVRRLALALQCEIADLWDDAEDFERQAAELVRKVPKESRETVLKMLRGAAQEIDRDAG